MPYIRDHTQLGYLPMRHHESDYDLDTRIVLAGAQIKIWEHPEGPILETDSAGDILGAFLWRANDTRPCPAWAFAWPVTTVTAPAGRRNGPAQPATVIRVNDRQPDSPILGEWSVKPIRDSNGADRRFDSKTPDTPIWASRFPKGWTGTVLAGTEERSQAETWQPAALGIVAVDQNGSSEVSTRVMDTTTTSEVDATRWAHAHALVRVVKRPSSTVVDFGDRNSIAIQYGKACSDGQAGFGLIADGPGVGGVDSTASEDIHITDVSKKNAPPGPKYVFATMAAKAGGPITFGAASDMHQLGTDSDGNPINSAHLQTNTLFEGHGGDAPLDFEEQRYVLPSANTRTVRVHLRRDPESAHDWIGGARPGRWRWLAEAPVYIVDSPLRDPSGTGRREPQPGGPYQPDPEPPRPPVPWPIPPEGPIPPSGGFEGPPDEPSSPRPDWFPKNFPRGLTHPLTPGRGIDIPDSFPNAPRSPLIPIPKDPKRNNIDIDPFGHAVPRPVVPTPIGERSRRHAGTFLDLAVPALLIRPQDFCGGSYSAADLRNAPDSRESDVERHDRTAPVIARIEGAYPKQASADPRALYTHPPHGADARYPGGTADGVVCVLPPEIGMEDSGTNFTPSGLTLSTVWFGGLREKVKCFSGRPMPGTGNSGAVGARDGWSWYTDNSGNLVHRSLDANGTETTRDTLSTSARTSGVKITWDTGLGLSITGGHVVGPADDDLWISGLGSKDAVIGIGTTEYLRARSSAGDVLSSKQLEFATGMGSLSHIQGPADQSFAINSGSNHDLILRRSGTEWIRGTATGIQALQAMLWGTGVGAITHITGPTDQEFRVSSGTGRDLALQRAASTRLIVGATTTTNLNQMTWAASASLTAHMVGPSDDAFGIASGTNKDLVLYRDATEYVRLGSSFVQPAKPIYMQSGGTSITGPDDAPFYVSSGSEQDFLLQRDATTVVKLLNGVLLEPQGRIGWPTGVGEGTAHIYGPADGTFFIRGREKTSSAASQAGNSVQVRAADATPGTSSAGAASGGALLLIAGDAKRLTSGSATGGDIQLNPGTGIGGGASGVTDFGQGTTALGSVLATIGNIPASGTAAQAAWLRIKVAGVVYGIPLWTIP